MRKDRQRLSNLRFHGKIQVMFLSFFVLLRDEEIDANHTDISIAELLASPPTLYLQSGAAQFGFVIRCILLLRVCLKSQN